MITITITIQAKTTEEALDALTEIEIRGNSEITSHCERMRDELCGSDSQDQEKDIVCSPKRKKKVSIHPRDEEAACVYGIIEPEKHEANKRVEKLEAALKIACEALDEIIKLNFGKFEVSVECDIAREAEAKIAEVMK